MAKLHARSDSPRSKGNRNLLRRQVNASWLDSFHLVEELASNLPDVKIARKYDGSPVLKVNGVFMAGIATHPSAELNTLVLRFELEDRAGLLEEAPEAYYTTNYYQRFPVVLVRLSAVAPEILRQLLIEAWRTTVRKIQRHKPKFD